MANDPPRNNRQDSTINAKTRQSLVLPEFSNIPTTDPMAALNFCKDLSQFLVEHSRSFNGDNTPDETTQSDSEDASGHHDTELLSVVIPVLNEEQNIPALHSRLTSVLQNEPMDYELIFVDDGSRDKTQEILIKLTDDDPRLIVLELARNFGHQTAITAGLDHAQGKAVIIMDGDLQDPPEVLPQFIAKWREGNDVVYAVRERRKEGWLKRASYAAFYRLLRSVANIEIPLDSGDFCIMDRRVVDLLINMPERNRFVRGIRSWLGLKQVGIPFERAPRYAGESKYTFSRLMVLALDGLVSFSYVPLRLITLLGFAVSVLSIVLAIVYFVMKLVYGLSPPGFATLIVSIFFLAGIQLITLGVIGEYVGRIFEEAKRRPLYVLRRTTRIR